MLALPNLKAQVIFDNGTSNLVDSTINDYIGVFDSLGGDSTTVTFSTGANVTGDIFDETVAGFETSIIIINDGTFEEDFAAYDFTSVTISGGTMNDDLNANDDSLINMNAGFLADDIQAFNSSLINLMGGSWGGYRIDRGDHQYQRGCDCRQRSRWTNPHRRKWNNLALGFCL